MRQFMREKEYGFEDMYSVEDALFNVELIPGAEYFDAKNEKEANQKVRSIRESIRREKEIGDAYWDKNRAYSEWTAKRIAGYREAYLYHCTYEKTFEKNTKVSKDEITNSINE